LTVPLPSQERSETSLQVVVFTQSYR